MEQCSELRGFVSFAKKEHDGRLQRVVIGKFDSWYGISTLSTDVSKFRQKLGLRVTLPKVFPVFGFAVDSRYIVEILIVSA